MEMHEYRHYVVLEQLLLQYIKNIRYCGLCIKILKHPKVTGSE